MIAALGFSTLSLLALCGALSLRVVAAVAALATLRVDRRELLRQLERNLVDVVPLALVGSVIIGGIVGMQGLNYLTRYNGTEAFGWASALSSYRDVGPLLLGFALAARTGAKNTAELAAMKGREQLDAVQALGLDPLRTLVWPRLWATVLVAVIVFPIATTLILGVSFVTARVVGDVPLAASFWSAVTYNNPGAIGAGLLRMVVFGIVIGTASCHAGLQVRGGDRSAAAVGSAVTLGSVVALGGIVVVNLVLSLAGGTS